jgi:phosphonate transport system permease protein
MVRLQAVDAAAIQRARQAAPAVFAPRWRQRLGQHTAALVLIGLAGYCLWLFDASPLRLWNGLGQLAAIVAHMFPPTAGEMFWQYLAAMAQTVGMAFIGTVVAALLAVPLGMLGARNVLPNWLARFVFRRSSDVLRGVDQLIWALIFVRAVGLGPLAGILAIIVSDTGTLAKLYSEAVENTERKAVDGVRACGGGRLLGIRFGILPQVLPVMLSSALYMFESNTRSATILGIVGAGGIGFFLSDRIRTMNWEEASFIVLLILVTVYLIDALSKAVRTRLIRGQTARTPLTPIPT